MKEFFIFFCLFLTRNLHSEESKLKATDLKDSFLLEKKEKKILYQYTLYQKANPFIPPVIEDLKPRMEIQVIHELQNYFLSELKLVGTWNVNEKEKKALIMTPDQKSFTVDINTPIGRKGGRISEINENSILVTYYELLPKGKKKKMTESIYLETTPTKGEKETQQKETIIIKENETNEITTPK
jgi:Tfp pilus assembly protein PilP